jgi:hypothetical protein
LPKRVDPLPINNARVRHKFFMSGLLNILGCRMSKPE